MPRSCALPSPSHQYSLSDICDVLFLQVKRDKEKNLHLAHTDSLTASHVIVLLLYFSVERRAGFTLSRTLFIKNVGSFNWGGRPYFSWEKTGDLIFSHHRPVRVLCVSCQFSMATFFAYHSPFTRGSPIFVGAPVRPNMLNMPKSASG